MRTPWRGIRRPRPERRYLVLGAMMEVDTFRAVPLVFRLTGSIARAVARSPGAVGYRLVAQPLRRRFWAVSAWEDEESLRRFVNLPNHRRAMVLLAPHVTPASVSVTWEMYGGGLPPSMRFVLAEMEERSGTADAGGRIGTTVAGGGARHSSRAPARAARASGTGCPMRAPAGAR